MFTKISSTLLFGSTILFAQGAQAVVDKLQKAVPAQAQVSQKLLKQNSTNLPAQKAMQNLPMPHKLTIQQAALKAVNSVRTHPQVCSAKSAPALLWNKFLYSMAKEHSIDMAVTGLLQHNGSGTQTDATAKRLNLTRGSYFYERVNQKINSKNLYSGELIVRTNVNSLTSPKTLIDYWIKNPKDCQLIMNPNFTDFAMAKVISHKDNRAYWTLLLSGKRK